MAESLRCWCGEESSDLWLDDGRQLCGRHWLALERARAARLSTVPFIPTPTVSNKVLDNGQGDC